MIQVDDKDPIELIKVTKAIQLLAVRVGNENLIKLADKVEKNPSLISNALKFI